MHLPKYMNGLVKSTALSLSAVIVKSVIAKSASFKIKGKEINLYNVYVLHENKIRDSLFKEM